MNNFLRLIFTIFAMIIISYESTFATEKEPEQDNFIKDFSTDTRPTLNKYGVHFPSLGQIEGEFYEFCQGLDANQNIQ